MTGGVGRLRIRSSSAVFEEQRAPGGREAHREASGVGCGVRESSEAGELESERNKAKTERCRYLRMRWVVAELEVTSASRFGHRSGGLPSSGGELRAAVRERRKGGARLGAL